MASLEPYAVALIVVAGCVVGFYVLLTAIRSWAEGAYAELLKSPSTNCDIDSFVGPKNPVDFVKVVLAHKFRLGSREASLDPIALELETSQHVPGLKVSRKAGTSKRTEDVVMLDEFLTEHSGSSKPPVVIGR